ncbi:unnamed protein product [Rhizophagus irregularis]|nr:unnamed protein product [Rhizophagus irregularis]
MEALFFNINDGYLEGIVRGYKSAVLNSTHYLNLTQCETLDDLKLQLSATDYGNFLANEPSPISTATIHEKATQKLVDEFKYVRANAVEPLSRFLDYLTLTSFGGTATSEAKTLDDRFFEHEVHLNKLTFQQHFHYAIFYAFLKLKEQEIRNIIT